MIGDGRKKWVIFIAITVFGFAIDAISKSVIVHELSQTRVVSILGSWLQFHLTYNTGAIFGLDPKAWIPSFPVNIFFYIFTSIAIAFLIIYYKMVEKNSTKTLIGISLIMPGAIGNLFDRIIRPQLGVVDFIKVDLRFWPFNPWPIFNCADIFITCGILLILLDMVLMELRLKKA